MAAVSDKAKKTSLSLRPSLQARVHPYVKKYYDDNFSGYVQKLIERDLAGLPPPGEHNDSIINDLARVYGGYFAPTLATQLRDLGTNQPDLLHHLLKELSDHFARGGTRQDLVIVDRKFTAAHPIPESERAKDTVRRPRVASGNATVTAALKAS